MFPNSLSLQVRKATEPVLKSYYSVLENNFLLYPIVECYNFSLVDAILPLMTTDDMKQMEKLTPPFELENNGIGYDNTSSIAGNSLILKYISSLLKELLQFLVLF